MKVSLFYASDGVIPEPKMLLIIDQNTELPPGRYEFVNCKVNGVEIGHQKIEFDVPVEVEQGINVDITPSVTCYRAQSPKIDYEKQEPLEDIRPDDTLAPYEAMYRMMEKLYHGRSDQELSDSRDKNFDEVYDSEDEDVDMVVSRFGLLKEEYLDEDTGEIIETSSGDTKVHIVKEPEPELEPEPEPEPEPPA